MAVRIVLLEKPIRVGNMVEDRDAWNLDVIRVLEERQKNVERMVEESDVLNLTVRRAQ